MLAICQTLPGPTSSQVGFSIGLQRAGITGAIAAAIAFMLPSAVLMVAFGFSTAFFSGTLAEGIFSGLKIVAVAIVAQAVIGMAKTLTPDRKRITIAMVIAIFVLIFTGPLGQLFGIALGALSGVLLCRSIPVTKAELFEITVNFKQGIVALSIFVLLLIAGPIIYFYSGFQTIEFFNIFYQAGSLVFGGGHVMLPLLESTVVQPGWVTEETFLTGYGAAQALPGPLFAFAGFLGVDSEVGPGGLAGAVLALVAIFLPGYLLLIAILPFWARIRNNVWVSAALTGVNAAVVGILAAALYSPVGISAITGVESFSLSLLCFVLLMTWKCPPWLVVLVGAGGGMILSFFA